jgi:glycosyltransferase involved in cell wall biosynthesis
VLRIVISAVNFTEGGALTVLRDCLASAVAVLPAECEIVALVNRKDLIDEPRIRLIAIPSSKKSWLHRLYWEWFGFMRISCELKPALWLSLHDITPRVAVVRQAVYCHNSSPFYSIGLREALMEPTFLMFNWFYALLYRIFIHRNYYVIVQQSWLRDEFTKRMGHLPIVVAHPSLPTFKRRLTRSVQGPTFVIIYPALARVFKNIETLCEACQILTRRGIENFEVRLTILGTENRYARWLLRRFGHVSQIKFIGLQSKVEMASHYNEADVVVFPSKLETWGLPITEAKAQRRPLLVADIPYARETVGNYNLVSFFPARSPDILAELIQSMMTKTWQPTGNSCPNPLQPFAPDWEGLWHILTDGLLRDT